MGGIVRMSAGFNRRCDIWHYSFQSDDSVGGANPTGTVSYWNVPLRMQANADSQLLLQQGLEVLHTFTGLIIPGTINVYERDEIEITKPRDDIYYGKRFRVIGVRYSDLNPRDPRNYIMFQLMRSETSHANLNQ
jgi:hypothetical protein